MAPDRLSGETPPVEFNWDSGLDVSDVSDDQQFEPNLRGTPYRNSSDLPFAGLAVEGYNGNDNDAVQAVPGVESFIEGNKMVWGNNHYCRPVHDTTSREESDENWLLSSQQISNQNETFRSWHRDRGQNYSSPHESEPLGADVPIDLDSSAAAGTEKDWQKLSDLLEEEETSPAPVNVNFPEFPAINFDQSVTEDSDDRTTSMPLRQWLDATSGHHRSTEQAGHQKQSLQNETLMQKITIAYGVSKLLQESKGKILDTAVSNSSSGAITNRNNALEMICNLDNFEMEISSSVRGLGNIDGLEMIMPPNSIHLKTRRFSDASSESIIKNNEEPLGRTIKAQVMCRELKANEGVQCNEGRLCFFFGCFLYELFSKKPPFDEGIELKIARVDTRQPSSSINARTEEPLRKKTFSEILSINEPTDFGKNVASQNLSFQIPDALSKCVPLHQLGFPSSLSFLVKSLLDCGWDDFCPDNSYSSLHQACSDLQLMLEKPESYLFDDRFLSSSFDKSKIFQTNQRTSIYGREKEAAIFTKEYCSHQNRGESTALFVAGYSGTGKSVLIKKSLDDIASAGGYVMEQKFQEMPHGSPISVVITAFDSFCLLLKDKCSPYEIELIVSELVKYFGTELTTLARLLPSVRSLSPKLVGIPNRANNELNLSSIYFTLQLFVRILSGQISRKIVLFLDDLQWADSASFDLILTILSDIKGSSVLFFIGSYRNNNEVDSYPLQQFISNLDFCNVHHSKLQLNGLDEESLNAMISDRLGVFPRLCRRLSNVVFRKTKGNPLFSVEFLSSLIDRDMLRFSLKERRWVWNEDDISGVDISDNVCDFLLAKMISLPKTTQEALKVASCFGNNMPACVAKHLNATSQYPSFEKDLEKAVDDGYMDKIGTDFCFVHDKVHEAAYGLIVGDKKQFHSSLGAILYEAVPEQELAREESMVNVITDQFNLGDIKSIRGEKAIRIAKLNLKAARKAMFSSNFTSARSYLITASKLLPGDKWQSNYTLALRVYLLLGNASYACGHTEEAMVFIEVVIKEGACLDDKLDAYSLMNVLLLSQQQHFGKSYSMSVEVLHKLGEKIPDEPGTNILQEIQQLLSGKSSDDFVGMKEMKSRRLLLLMKLYFQAGFASFFVKPQMLLFFACKLVELSLLHGVSKYTGTGLGIYAMVSLSKCGDPNIARGVYFVGKISLALLSRFNAVDHAKLQVYQMYYSYVAVNFEPLQSTANMLRLGFDQACSVGDTCLAPLIGLQYSQKAFFSGANLIDLNKWNNYLSRLIDDYSQTAWKSYAALLRVTTEILIGKSGFIDSETESKNPHLSEASMFHRITRTFWIGHYERCEFIARQYPVSGVASFQNIMVLFYQGVSALCSARQRKKIPFHETGRKSIKALKEFSKMSSWNYDNKVAILEAMLLSSLGEKSAAKKMFTSAIEKSCASKFIHEQGLACELAGLHFKRAGDTENALHFLSQANECYKKWGSTMKAEAVAAEMKRIHKKC